MTASLLTPDVENAIRRALLATWSPQTQPSFLAIVPAYNQCAQTALVIFERFGGEILQTKISLHDGSEVEHFYNRIGGQRYDFTEEQFVISDFVKPIVYHDILSSLQEAEGTLQPSQLQAMRNGFASAYGDGSAG
jgi:hypothetical protein